MSTRLSLTSRRDTWDYFRIDPDAVALSKAQAQELCRLDDDVKRHLFSHFPEFLRYLLPEHRDEVMATIGRFDTADRIPDRRNPASVSRPDLANLASAPLSDDEAAAVLVETLAVVEEAGETLRRNLRAAVTKRDRDELHKLMSSNIWSRWFLSHVIAPFLDDYAIILDGMGIDPEQVRQQAASHHAARSSEPFQTSPVHPTPHPPTPAHNGESTLATLSAAPSPVLPVYPASQSPSPQHPAAQVQPQAAPPPPFRTNGFPSALGAQAEIPSPIPTPRPKPAPPPDPNAATPQAPSPPAAQSAAAAAHASSTAPSLPTHPAAPPLPATTTPAPARRQFSTTVMLGPNLVPMDVIDRVADSVPHPDNMKTAELVTSYGTLLTLTDAIEARLREDLPDAPFSTIGDPANACILQVIAHPLGKSYARAIGNRVTIATTLLDRPDITPHLAAGLRDLHARLTADTGHPLPTTPPSSFPASDSLPSAPAASTAQAQAAPSSHPALQPSPQLLPPANPSAAIALARATSHNPAQPPATSQHQPVTPVGAADPAASAAAPSVNSAAQPVPRPAPTVQLLPPAPSPVAHPIPTAAPGSVFPGHAHPFPAATTQPPGPPPGMPPIPSPIPSPLTADPLSPLAPARPAATIGAASSPSAIASPTAQAAQPSRFGGLPSLAALIVPFAAALDLIVTWHRNRRKAAKIRKAARRQCAPPPATQPKSTAFRALWRVFKWSAFFIILITAGIFAWRVYQAPPSWLLAAPPQTRYVVTAYRVLVPVFPTPEDARMARIEPGRTPTINPGARYAVIASQGDVLQLAITDTKGKPTTGWVSADLMRDVLADP